MKRGMISAAAVLLLLAGCGTHASSAAQKKHNFRYYASQAGLPTENVGTSTKATHHRSKKPKPKPHVTVAQENALRSAHEYLSAQGYSRAGLIAQLSSSYGSGYRLADATWAVDHLRVSWSVQAVRAAKLYLQVQGYSRAGLIAQLSSAYGSQFTVAQATYAANHVGL